MSVKKIVFTGSPGSGKTTLLNIFKTLNNYRCIDESSREIIIKNQKAGIDNIFRKSPLEFSKLLLENRIDQYNENKNHKETLIFDRGIPDILAYLNNENFKELNTFESASLKYKYDLIFIFEPWKEIYSTDNERKESFDEAIQIHKQILNTYSKLGYLPIPVPKRSIEERKKFVIEEISRYDSN